MRETERRMTKLRYKYICDIKYRFVTNRFLTHNHMAHAVDQNVEWAYAFDVHCNSFFPVFLILYVLQFFFMPLLQRSNWISLFVGNTMYFTSIIWYIYGTFLGFNGKCI